MSLPTPDRLGFIDLHLLQVLPYANVNRDEVGTPKSAVYGGALRARVSSQSWKRAARDLMEVGAADEALRTKRIGGEIVAVLMHDGWSEAAAILAATGLLDATGLKTGKGKDVLSSTVLVYLTRSQIAGLAALAEVHRGDFDTAVDAGKAAKVTFDQAAVRGILSQVRGTVALLGRMLAAVPGSQVDSAVQVMHALTTHAAEIEVDFFTAVDDLAPSTEPGAGMMGGLEHTSGTFYRYLTIDLDALVSNCAGDADMARRLANDFLEAMTMSVPGGKKASTAPQTAPDLALVNVRKDRPVNLVGAFERPIRSNDGHLVRSVEALAAYRTRVQELWAGDGETWSSWAGTIDDVSGLGDRARRFGDLFTGALDHAFGDA